MQWVFILTILAACGAVLGIGMAVYWRPSHHRVPWVLVNGAMLCGLAAASLLVYERVVYQCPSRYPLCLAEGARVGVDLDRLRRSTGGARAVLLATDLRARVSYVVAEGSDGEEAATAVWQGVEIDEAYYQLVEPIREDVVDVDPSTTSGLLRRIYDRGGVTLAHVVRVDEMGSFTLYLSVHYTATPAPGARMRVRGFANRFRVRR